VSYIPAVFIINDDKQLISHEGQLVHRESYMGMYQKPVTAIISFYRFDFVDIV